MQLPAGNGREEEYAYVLTFAEQRRWERLLFRASLLPRLAEVYRSSYNGKRQIFEELWLRCIDLHRAE